MRTDILQQARDIRASMDAAASALTDEQAAQSCFSICRMSWWGITLI